MAAIGNQQPYTKTNELQHTLNSVTVLFTVLQDGSSSL